MILLMSGLRFWNNKNIYSLFIINQIDVTMKKQPQVKRKNESRIRKELVSALLPDLMSESIKDSPLFKQMVVSAMKKKFVIQSDNGNVRTGLARAEDKIGKALDASADNTDASMPNLKYAKQKYKNMDSVLKYVETPGDNSAVKLVIMNFND